MNALERIRSAGFEVWLKDNGNIGIKPFNTLNLEQLKFLKMHKAEIVSALSANDAIATAPAAETNVNHSITCKTCIHFKSYHEHGGGAGTCKAEVMPCGACQWADTVHQCDKYLSRNQPETGTGSEAVHNAEGRFFKWLITLSDGRGVMAAAMSRRTLVENQELFPDAVAIEPVIGEDYKDE
jgi:hypothetical protein